MKGRKRNSKTKRNGIFHGKGSKIEQSGRLCLLFEKPPERRIDVLAITYPPKNVLAIDTSERLGISQLSPLKHASAAWRVGFASLGSKIYVIGGDVDRETGKYPKQVYFWDFDSNEKQWRKGPWLNGRKPNPMVVTVNKKIYALAGDSLWRYETSDDEEIDGTSEKANHVFEVLDPEFGDVWTPLPNPPFLSLYAKSYYGVDFLGHTVIGCNIYFRVVESSDLVTLYSFNVIEKKWKMHDNNSGTASAGSDDLIFHNLSLGGWFLGADVVDYLLYWTVLDYPGKGMKVYAYDLTARKEDEEQETEEEDAETFGDDDMSSTSFKSDGSSESYGGYCFPDDDDLVTVPIYGLNDVTDTVPGSDFTKGFVVHLRDKMFCLVCLYSSWDWECRKSSRHVRACVFEVDSVEMSKGTEFIKRYLAAKNVTQADWTINPELGLFSARCKIPNKGQQMHFRRPEFRHEGKPNSYQDDVAGKVIRNRKRNPVREINTRMIKGD